MSDQDRRTPPWLFKQLQKKVQKKFMLDAAASKHNALCSHYYTVKENGLEQRWYQATFCNPQWKHFERWIKKAFKESLERRITTCCVGPTGCSQEWFHKYAKRGTIFAPDQRIVFFSSDKGEPTHGADRDTMVYVFGPNWWNANAKLNQFLVKPLHIKGMVVTKKRKV